MDDSLSIPNPEQQKKRRFHPLRNLRRIFRRRTINTTSDTAVNVLTPQISASERNLRSATLSAISKTATFLPQQFGQQEVHDTYSSQSLPKFKTCGQSEQEIGSVECNNVRLHEQQEDIKEDPFVQFDMCSTAPNQRASIYHTNQLRQSLGDGVFPKEKNCDRERKLHKVDDCSPYYFRFGDNDSINKLILGDKNASSTNSRVLPGAILREMSNSQRSLNEERLFEIENPCEGLSQSHNSVFSQPGTASNLSIVLNSELTDVLKNRRNRSEFSDEEFSFQQSPNSPNRRVKKTNSKICHQKELTSLSFHNIKKLKDENLKPTCKNVCAEDSNYSFGSCSRSLVSSSEQMSRNPSFEAIDDIDFFSSHRQMLSHDAARHKMAIRPIKRKAPSHLKRKNVEIVAKKTHQKETSKLANSDLTNIQDRNFKSFPVQKFLPSTNASGAISADLKRNMVKSVGETGECNQTLKTNSNSIYHFETKEGKIERITASHAETSESGFLRRLINRNSKRSITKSHVDQSPIDESEPKKMQLNATCSDPKLAFPNKESIKSTSIETHFKDNIGKPNEQISQENFSATKIVIEPLKNSHVFQESNEKFTDKPKSGPAARQRCMPKNISEKPNIADNEIFRSTSLIKDITSINLQNSSSLSSLKTDHNQNKIPKINKSIPILDKITRSSECIVPALSSNSMETSTDDPLDYYEEKQRRFVEKSSSIKNQHDALTSSTINNNLPSLPDLPISIRVPSAYLGATLETSSLCAPPTTHEQSKSVSLDFEINDNLFTIKTNESATSSRSWKQKKGYTLDSGIEIFTNRNNSINIPTLPEIEKNIDMIVKSSFTRNPAKRFGPNLFQKQSDGKTNIEHNQTIGLIENTEKQRELYFLDKGNERFPETPTLRQRDKTMSLCLPAEKEIKFVERKSEPINNLRDTSEQLKSAVNINSSLPEFLKVHLNPIEQGRTKKEGNLVLAKNVRQDIRSPSLTECKSGEHEDLSLSNDSSSLSINECPQKLVEQDAKTCSLNFVARPKQSERCSPATMIQTTIPNNSKKPISILLEGPPASPNEFFKDTSVKLSIQERKRIFLSEDISKTPIPNGEHLNSKNNNGNKSNFVEGNLKNTSKTDENQSVQPPDPQPMEPSLVVLRKKSFRSHLPSGSNVHTSLKEADSTPELMKVFARRSLKIKDEDTKIIYEKDNFVNVETNNINKQCNPVGSTKSPCTQVYVDSDKENQSTSVEKLHKISKNDEATLSFNNKNLADMGGWPNSNISNRNSVADFRQYFGKIIGKSNNNQNSNTNVHGTKTSHLPLNNGGCPSGNKAHNSTTNIISTHKPKSNCENSNSNIDIKPVTIFAREKSVNSCEPAPSSLSKRSNTIERSVTVGEFKGIHQRRAEWEQRVKEAFK